MIISLFKSRRDCRRDQRSFLSIRICSSWYFRTKSISTRRKGRRKRISCVNCWVFSSDRYPTNNKRIIGFILPDISYPKLVFLEALEGWAKDSLRLVVLLVPAAHFVHRGDKSDKVEFCYLLIFLFWVFRWIDKWQTSKGMRLFVKMQLFNRTYCTRDINLKIFPENDNLHLWKNYQEL